MLIIFIGVNVMNNETNTKKTNSKEVVKALFDERREFVVFGICGKTGSGVTTVSKILKNDFYELNLPKPCEESHADFNKTEYRILYNFAESNWKSFYTIKTSTLITLTALQKSPNEFCNYINEIKTFSNDVKTKIETRIKDFYEESITFDISNLTINKYPITIKNPEIKKFETFLNDQDILFNKNNLEYNFRLTELAKLYDKYKELREDKEEINNYLVYEILFQFIYSEKNGFQNHVNKFWAELSEATEIKITTIALQGMGNNLRITGENPFSASSEDFNCDGFLSIAELININIKLLRDYKSKKINYCRKNNIIKEIKSNPDEIFKEERRTFIVIDSIKNPYESNYLKTRYSNYYLITVYTDEEKRKKRLLYNEKLEQNDIKTIDIIEQLSEFKNFQSNYLKEKEQNKYSRTEEKLAEETEEKLLEDDELIILKKITDKMIALNCDSIYPFIMQNIQSCIELADIFINNEDDSASRLKLKKILLRYTSLIMSPGLVLPTKIERIMQIANTAKLCSGCISRQVGAVITDNLYNLRSIGWNHVPENHMPCLYRDINEVYNHYNEEAYSCFENDDTAKFQKSIRNAVKNYYSKDPEDIYANGRTIPYCFKDIYNEISGAKNQIHPRALHAEETAFLNLTNTGSNDIRGGFLFTTSSPCELCAKKAMYMGISAVYYIQPYPGISENHILKAGPKNQQPDLVLYTGAIGRAYTQLYTPLIPKKDEMELWLKHKISIDEKHYKRSEKNEE